MEKESPASLQALMDAGCDGPTIRRFQSLEGQTECRAVIRRQQMLLLRRQRKMLLEQLHLCQHKIDCLDHLIYRMQQKEEGP